MSEYTPTNRLRFVERHAPVDWNSDKSGKAGMVDTTKKIRVLQQWWEPADMLHPSAGEWRDVSLEAE